MPFQPQKNLPKGTLFTAKQMRFGSGGKVKQNAAMNQILQNKEIARVLDKKVEQVEFLNTLKKQVGEGKSVKKDDLRKVMGHFRSGRGSSIDKEEAQKMANQFFSHSMERKYIFTKEEKNADKPARNNPIVSPRGENGPVAKPKNSSGGGVTRHSKLF